MPNMSQEREVTEPKEGDLLFWWVPQVPMKPFEMPIKDIEQGELLMNAFAEYDLFQYENNIKHDSCNAGGVSRWEDNGEGGFGWFDWTNEDGENIDEIRSRQKE